MCAASGSCTNIFAPLCWIVCEAGSIMLAMLIIDTFRRGASLMNTGCLRRVPRTA